MLVYLFRMLFLLLFIISAHSQNFDYFEMDLVRDYPVDGRENGIGFSAGQGYTGSDGISHEALVGNSILFFDEFESTRSYYVIPGDNLSRVIRLKEKDYFDIELDSITPLPYEIRMNEQNFVIVQKNNQFISWWNSGINLFETVYTGFRSDEKMSTLLLEDLLFVFLEEELELIMSFENREINIVTENLENYLSGKGVIVYDDLIISNGKYYTNNSKSLFDYLDANNPTDPRNILRDKYDFSTSYINQNFFYAGQDYANNLYFVRSSKLSGQLFIFNLETLKLEALYHRYDGGANPLFLVRNDSRVFRFFHNIQENVVELKKFDYLNLYEIENQIGERQIDILNSQLSQYTYGILNDSGVRVRTSPVFNGSDTVGYLEVNDRVRIYSITFDEMPIGNMNSPWYFIRRESDGLSGWTYGEFVDFVN